MTLFEVLFLYRAAYGGAWYFHDVVVVAELRLNGVVVVLVYEDILERV